MILAVVKKSLLLLIVYWILMFTAGYELSKYTARFVLHLDDQYLVVSRNYLALALGFFLLGVGWTLMMPKRHHLTVKTQTKMELSVDFTLVPFVLSFLFCFLAFFATFRAVGYVPLFHSAPGAKYFQDASSIYLNYRPVYTLAMNLATASVMTLILIYFSSPKSSQKFKAFLLIGAFSFLIAMTAKRGALLLPFAYLVIGFFLIGRISYLRGFFLFSVLILLAGLMHFYFNEGENAIVGLANSLANSFLVGNRELARFFTNFDGEFLYGKSFLAALTSFIPTSMNEIKEMFLYPRYLIHIEGGDPDLSGGPRGTFVGEMYANFGILGVILGSWFFGFFIFFIFKCVARLSLFSNNHVSLGFMCAFVLHQGVLAFFENGSAFIFHFASKLVFILILIEFSRTKFRFRRKPLLKVGS